MKKFSKYLLISAAVTSSIGLTDSKATEQRDIDIIPKMYKKEKKNNLTQEILQHAAGFIELFRQGNVNKENFDETIFNEPHFSSFYSISSSIENMTMNDHIPMGELKALTDAIKACPINIKESVFSLFDEINADYFDIYNNKKKLFFIVNHLLGNQKTTRLAKESLENYLGSYSDGNSYIDPVTATYVYVLLDSESIEDQKIAKKLLEKIPDLAFNEIASYLPPFIQQLNFSANTSEVDNFMRWVVGNLPKYMGDPEFGCSPCYVAESLKFVAPLFVNSSYNTLASDFIKSIVDGSLKIQNHDNPSAALLMAIPILLSFQETQNYAIDLFKQKVLSNKTLKAQDKWKAISRLAQKDNVKTNRYFKKIWNDIQNEEDQIQLIFRSIQDSNLDALDDILFPKVPSLFDKMAGNIKTLLEAQDFYNAGNNLYHFINFLASSKSDLSERIGKDKISDLVNQVLQLPEDALATIYYQDILSQNLMRLVQKSGLNTEEILVNYSRSSTVNPQFFINISKDIPEKDSLLLKIYQSPETPEHLKVKVLIDLARASGSNPTLPKDTLISDLFNLLESENKFQEKLGIYDGLIKLDDPEINIKVLKNISQHFKQENLDQKRQLFMILSNNSTIDKEGEYFQTVFNALLDQATDPYIDLSLRKNLVDELKNGAPQLTTYFTMLENLYVLEDTIKRTVFDIGGIQGNDYQSHSNTIVKKLKFIVESIRKTLDTYQLEDPLYDQDDLIKKTEALLDNTELMKEALGLGEETEKYITEAKNNLKVFKNLNVWNGINRELESTRIDGQTITLGQTYSLFFHYIANQKGTESYLSLIAGLVQALSSTQAINGCKDGAMSQMSLSIFKEHFKEENQQGKEVRSLRDFQTRIPQRLELLKTILIHFLSEYKPGTPVFNIQDAFLGKNFPDIERNDFLESTFIILNETPLEQIFGDEIHNKIPTLFSKLRDLDFKPSPAESKTIKDVYSLIIKPAFLAFLSKEYSDFVVFEPVPEDQNRGDKLFFPGYVKEIEDYELVTYNPELLK